MKEAPYLKSYLLVCTNKGRLLDTKQQDACEDHWHDESEVVE
jgi:hypothetical protein